MNPLRKLSVRLNKDGGGDSSSTITTTPMRNKLSVLAKNKKEFCSKLCFSDISHHLLTSQYFSRDDAFEICILPLHQQMQLVYEKLVVALQSPTSSRKEYKGRPDLWIILLRAIAVQHSGLTCKLDSDLHKLSKREKPPRLRKEDIGAPQDFKHVKHIGHTPSSNPFRRFFSLRSTTPSSNSVSVSSLFPSNNTEHSMEDAELVKAFFLKAGVTDLHLKKQGSRKLILDFIQRNGGIDAIRKEIIRQEQEHHQGTTEANCEITAAENDGGDDTVPSSPPTSSSANKPDSIQTYHPPDLPR